MIHCYRAKNFFSIKDEVLVDLRVTDSQHSRSPQPDTYQKDSQGNSISLSSVVIGPNASGKTNLLKVLGFLSYLICKAGDAEVQHHPFAGDEDKDSYFEVRFSLDDTVYTYSLTIKRQRIIRETLKQKLFSTKNLTTRLVFDRIWDSQKAQFKIINKKLKIPQGLNPSGKMSLIASVNLLNKSDQIAQAVYSYWESAIFNVDYDGTHQGDINYKSQQQIRLVHNDLLTNEEIIKKRFKKILQTQEGARLIKDSAIDMLRQLDINFAGFNKTTTGYHIHHKLSQKDKIPFGLESSGTKQLITSAIMMSSSLTAGGSFYIADEMDNYLHPLATEALLELFQSKSKTLTEFS